MSPKFIPHQEILRRQRRFIRKPTDRVQDELKYIDQGNIRQDWKDFESRGEFWTQNGTPDRFKEIFVDVLKEKPLSFLINLRKPNPKVMLLGPGQGYEVFGLKEELNPKGIDPSIDVLGLSKSIIPDAKKLVENDFSVGTPLEFLDVNNPVHKKIIDAMTGKYDLIMAPSSVGYHTNNPVQSCFFTALMLAKGGEAYIELKRDIPQIDRLQFVFRKLTEAYNKRQKENPNLKFEILPVANDIHGIYFRIRRLN